MHAPRAPHLNFYKPISGVLVYFQGGRDVVA